MAGANGAIDWRVNDGRTELRMPIVRTHDEVVAMLERATESDPYVLGVHDALEWMLGQLWDETLIQFLEDA